MIKIEHLTTGYNKKKVLHNVSMELAGGSIYLLIGPNGAGKSTLLKAIAGFIKVWDGIIIFRGRDITLLSPASRARRGVGYFFQGGVVFKNLTARENLEIAGMDMDRKLLLKKMKEMYTLFPKLENLQSRRAGFLSGGEKSQLALSLVFIRNPSLVLLDEPSAGLAPSIVKEVLGSIKILQEKNSATVLMVEQNVLEGLKVADYIFQMRSGEIKASAQPAKTFDASSLESLYFR